MQILIWEPLPLVYTIWYFKIHLYGRFIFSCLFPDLTSKYFVFFVIIFMEMVIINILIILFR